jgi:dCMP deaminase
MSKEKNKKFMFEILDVVANQSYCKRKKVGCVIAKDNHILSTGYNGTIPKTENICEDELGFTKDIVIHAEINAIAKAVKEGISINGATLYCNYTPCMECAKLIIQSGIKEVIYLEEYKDLRPIQYMRKAGILLKKREEK